MESSSAAPTSPAVEWLSASGNSPERLSSTKNMAAGTEEKRATHSQPLPSQLSSSHTQSLARWSLLPGGG